MRCLIFAAGLGTRLKPLTDSIPKALVPICERTLLEHLITKLKRADFNEIVVNIHHLAPMVREFVADNGYFDAKIFFSDESDYLRETGGGIKYAAALLNDGEPFLVHNVDILSNLNISDFYEAHLAASISADTPLATILVSDRITQRYLLFDTDNNLSGWMNMATGEVKSPFPELRRAPSNHFNPDNFLIENKLSKYAFAGTHVISPEIFRLMQGLPEKFSIIDFYLDIADKYIIKAYVKEDLEMVDVGKLHTISAAEEFIKKGKGV